MAEIIDDIAHLSQEIGPHPAGTEEEQQAALYLAEKLQREAGFSTIIEDFQCVTNPHLVRIICFAVALVSVIVPFVMPVAGIPCFILCAVAAVLYYLEVLGKPVLSRLFRSGASQNVVAKYQPGGAAGNTRRRKVILVANYDSGRVLKEEKEPLAKLLPLLQQASAIALVVAPVLLLIKTLFLAGDTGVLSAIFTVLFVVCAVLFVLPLVRAALFAAAPYNQSANNNASGVSVLLEVARTVGRGLVSSSEMEERADRDPSVVHGEAAARAAGVVPEGATVEYEAEENALSPQESLAAAKAAIAALTGKPVADKVPVTDISSRLVKGGGLTPEDETATSVHFEVGTTPHQESSRSRRVVVSAEEDPIEFEEAMDAISAPAEPKPAKSGPERLNQAAPQSPVAQIAAAEAARAMAEAEAAKARAEQEAQAAAEGASAGLGGFERTTPEALQQGMTGAMTQVDKTPAWARSAQAKARANKPQASQPHAVARSRYADTLAAQLLEHPTHPQGAQTQMHDSSLVDGSVDTAGSAALEEHQPEVTPEQSALSARLAALRSEIEATQAPHVSEEAKAALAHMEPVTETAPISAEQVAHNVVSAAAPVAAVQSGTVGVEQTHSAAATQTAPIPAEQVTRNATPAAAVVSGAAEQTHPAASSADVVVKSSVDSAVVSGVVSSEASHDAPTEPVELDESVETTKSSDSIEPTHHRPSSRSHTHSVRGGFASRFKEVTSRVSQGLSERRADNHKASTDAYAADEYDEAVMADQDTVSANAQEHTGREDMGRTKAFTKQLHGARTQSQPENQPVDQLEDQLEDQAQDQAEAQDQIQDQTEVQAQTQTEGQVPAQDQAGSQEVNSQAQGSAQNTEASNAAPTAASNAAPAIKSDDSPHATAAMSPIDVSAFLDKEAVPEEYETADTHRTQALAAPVAPAASVALSAVPSAAVSAVGVGAAVPVAGAGVEADIDAAALSDEVTQRVSAEEIQEAIHEAAVASPIVGMEALLPSISAPQPVVEEDPDQPHSQVIVLPSVSATHTANTDDMKQRAPMADVSESTQAGTKSLLSNMLPKIDDPGASAPLPSLDDIEEGDSTSLDLPTLGDTNGSQAVSMTGSFSTVGGTGSFAPVGDELVADVDPEDRYVDDADDSAYDEEYTETGAFAGPGYVDMPKSRAGRFFSRFRSKKKRAQQQEDTSVREWVDVDEDYTARSVGQARGDWSSFRQDDGVDSVSDVAPASGAYAEAAYTDTYADDYDSDYPAEYADEYVDVATEPGAYADEYAPANDGFIDIDYHETSFDNRRGWNGGAFSLSRMREGLSSARKGNPEPVEHEEYDEVGYVETDPAVRVDGNTEAAEQINRELKKLQDFRHPDIDTEVWFVALGAELYSHSGINAFLDEHAAEMKGAIIINLEALGTGELACLEQEGVIKPRKPSSRSKRFLRQASERSGVSFRSATLRSRETPASIAMARGIQALTIAGMGDANTVLYGAENDVVENLDAESLSDSARFVMAILKSI